MYFDTPFFHHDISFHPWHIYYIYIFISTNKRPKRIKSNQDSNFGEKPIKIIVISNKNNNNNNTNNNDDNSNNNNNNNEKTYRDI